MASKIKRKTIVRIAAPHGLSNPEGLIFDIKRFSVHDGPGVRTTVFLKGCKLRCMWCDNPESINPKPEILLYAGKCIGCGTCFKVCPNRAHRIDASGKRTFIRNLCDLCGRCIESCYSEALMMAGRKVSVDDVMAVVREDAKFYKISGGGVTLSGGEPLLQSEFSMAILKQCKTEGFHTAIETSGNVAWEAIEQVLPYVDMWLYDFKHISSQFHKRYTGVSNRLILNNLRRLSNYDISIEIHMPIIPTINDSRKTIEATARLFKSLNNIMAVKLIPYHRLAGSKYQSLGRKNTMPNQTSPSKSRLREIARWIRKYDLKVIVPSMGINSRRPYSVKNHDVDEDRSKESNISLRSVDRSIDRDEID